MVRARAAYLKNDYSMLDDQSESLINKTIFLTLTRLYSVKQIRIGKPNNLYLQLAEKVDDSLFFLSRSASLEILHNFVYLNDFENIVFIA